MKIHLLQYPVHRVPARFKHPRVNLRSGHQAGNSRDLHMHRKQKTKFLKFKHLQFPQDTNLDTLEVKKQKSEKQDAFCFGCSFDHRKVFKKITELYKFG